ncbi:uncharacterized protein K452DRAFT_338843 [Aplosporella prunicola CBS 121167]|uniref:Major facilitator superfamily (MFS) profile domain-containing protein n=1 Tax=Aplosporella prunicola CBS 121167 TaxID=1176127 RepID=A0A6A6B5G6_9PEZI|nr:uncharacterized protein K452DRAFT_338843 [Aplosporella prunicola CBS 121167]KAF2138217.1 hypothetical protein K452DRAFT_338843 [Aplosporella prunicola CBS 121167]
MSFLSFHTALTPPQTPYSAFPPARRRLILLIVTAAGFFGPLSGAVYLPSLVVFQDVFDASAAAVNASITVYMAVFAVAPLLGAPLSDHFGRRPVYLSTLLLFITANILLSTLPASLAALFVLRVFQALGACVVTSVGAGVVADVYEPAVRASAMAVFLLGPQLGPILGPVIGGQFASAGSWRWGFAFLALACFPVYLAVALLLPETLRCIVGNGSTSISTSSSNWFIIPRLRLRAPPAPRSDKFPRPLRPSLRTFVQLLQYPPHLIVSVNGALQFAGLYCIYTSFPRVLKTVYGFSTREVGYAYLAPGLVMLLASLVAGRASDAHRRRLIARNAGVKPPPEHRIPPQLLAFALTAAAKTAYGWLCAYGVHVAASLTMSALASFGMTLVFVTSTSYQTEADPSHAASLVALGGLLRNAAGAVAAAIISPVLDAMGLGWCFTGLGLLDLCCMGGVVVVMWKGAKFREGLEGRR